MTISEQQEMESLRRENAFLKSVIRELLENESNETTQ